jgi:hypothetical protein
MKLPEGTEISLLIEPSQAHGDARKPQAYQFRSPQMREPIEKAETLMRKFVPGHPFCKQHLLG